jgi:hypothetical protein
MIHGRNHGVALVSVLLIVAVVSALAYHLMTHHSLTLAALEIAFCVGGVQDIFCDSGVPRPCSRRLVRLPL